MAKEKVSGPEKEYFTMERTTHNKFVLETILVVDGKVVKTERSEETFMPIVFDMFKRKTLDTFMKVLTENSNG